MNENCVTRFQNHSSMDHFLSHRRLLIRISTRSYCSLKEINVIFRYANNSEDYPDIQLLIASAADITEGGLFRKRQLNLGSDIYARLYEDILYRESYLIMPLLLRPQSKGYIKLRSSDPYEHPAIVPNYFDDPHDLDVLVMLLISLVFINKTTFSMLQFSHVYRTPY